jgi:C4-dicarboxylate-specific signal transduction histidine kinase
MAQIRKATEIISHLRTFGRASPMAFEPADVHEIIERALSLVQEQLKQRGIEVVFDLCDEDVSVLSNPIQLEQVFINLLTNARDALEGSDVREIRIASRLRDDTVFITFSDTGPGIAPELEPRVFDPFFTTKEVGSGTGLGLSITYSIVKEHGGEISVVSRPGEGAMFTIELPRGGERPPVEPLL